MIYTLEIYDPRDDFIWERVRLTQPELAMFQRRLRSHLKGNRRIRYLDEDGAPVRFAQNGKIVPDNSAIVANNR